MQSFGGKGVFVSELEEALLSGQIDLAVHSAKDMPAKLDNGLCIAAVSTREYPGDVLLTRKDTKLDHLKGNSFCCRNFQSKKTMFLQGILGVFMESKRVWPGSGTDFETLRGNVHTRLKKLKDGLYDGIILAQAGLARLGITESDDLCFYPLDPEHFILAGGQGILAVEVKEGSPAARLCEKIDVPNAHICLNAERGGTGLLKCRLPRTYWRIRPDRRNKLILQAAGAVSGPSGDGVKHICITGSCEKK